MELKANSIQVFCGASKGYPRNSIFFFVKLLYSGVGLPLRNPKATSWKTKSGNLASSLYKHPSYFLPPTAIGPFSQLVAHNSQSKRVVEHSRLRPSAEAKETGVSRDSWDSHA